MKLDFTTWQGVVSIVAGTLTVAVTVWKIILPIVRRAFKLQVVYAARIAELQQRAPTFVGFQIASPLQAYVPFGNGFPSYSDWSTETPNWPPRAHELSTQLGAALQRELAGLALVQARRWERTTDQRMRLLALDVDSDPNAALYQTYVRLRRFLLEEANSDFAIVSSRIGNDCAEALRRLETELEQMLERLPTRILIVRVANRGSLDARDLRIDVTVGGAIYDVTMNEQRDPGLVERTSNRFSVNFAVLQPGYTVDLRIWYRWNAAAFGSRVLSQCDRFPGREGVLINYIGISNGRARPLPKLMRDLRLWRSMSTKIGPEPGFD
jgi:hypothetical protein